MILLCEICSEPANWAVARLEDRKVWGFCCPSCVRISLDAVEAGEALVLASPVRVSGPPGKAMEDAEVLSERPP